MTIFGGRRFGRICHARDAVRGAWGNGTRRGGGVIVDFDFAPAAATAFEDQKLLPYTAETVVAFDFTPAAAEAGVSLKLMDKNYLGVVCERSSFRLVAQPAEDFPTDPGPQNPAAPLAFPFRVKRYFEFVTPFVSAS